MSQPTTVDTKKHDPKVPHPAPAHHAQRAKPATSSGAHRGHDGTHVSPPDGRNGDHGHTAALLHSIRGMGSKPKPAQHPTSSPTANVSKVLNSETANGVQALGTGGSKIASAAHSVGDIADTVSSIDGSIKDKVIKAIKPSADVGTVKPAVFTAAAKPGKVSSLLGKLKDTGGKIAGPLGIVTGGIGLVGAISQLRHGKSVQGVGNLVESGSTTGSGVAGTAAAFNLAGTAEKVATLGKVSGVLGGVSAVAEGGLDIYSGIKGHNGGKVALGGVKTVAGGLMIAGAATGDPIMAIGGGLLYGGAEVWQNRKAIGHVFSEGAHDVAHVASAGYHAVSHAVSSVVDDLNPF